MLLGIGPKDILIDLEVVYGDASLSDTTVKEWAKRFCEGRELLEDEERIGRPRSAITSSNTSEIRWRVEEDPNITVEELVKDMDCSYLTYEELVECQDIDLDRLPYLNRKEKKYIRKERRNLRAKRYQRERRQDYLQDINNLELEKARLELELAFIVKERDELWNKELKLLKSL
ncbi:hypothetical protein LOD99_791 [Oopsacas minuta]|uniref:BZIP domain-containing protein n=1 Tax=Oopsacas minuta TaxID=111878 RepID=A0AAV7K1D1_9METZ|nr:hypothetical protein LOD99_791 [Oopsacas minuta]